MEELSPPDRFGLVEPQVFRSAFPAAVSFPHVKLLQLRTVVNLSQEAVTRGVAAFFEENHIVLHNVGLDVWTYQNCPTISTELVIEAMRFLLDESFHPLLIMSASGSHQVGVIVGCLRRLQHWNLSSMLDEYRAFAAPSPRLDCEHFIEMFDTDLLALPPNPPRWFDHQQQMLAADRAEWAASATLSADGAGYHPISGPLVSPGVSTTLVSGDEAD